MRGAEFACTIVMIKWVKSQSACALAIRTSRSYNTKHSINIQNIGGVDFKTAYKFMEINLHFI